jgi:hypothetical protein
MMPWPGCRLATANASYWHAAYDFATRTLCGTPVTAGMAEDRVSTAMEMCRRCAAAMATRTGATK